GLGDGIALADRLVDPLVAVLEDGVHARLADDRQRFQDGHAGADQRPQGAHGPGHHRLFDQLAHDGYPEFEAVEDVVARLVQPDQFKHQPQGDGHQRNHVPVFHEPARGVDQGQGDPGQLQLEIREDLLELGDDEDHDEAEDGHGHEDDHARIDHGPGDAPLEALGLFLGVGQALEDDFQGAAGLGGLDRVDVQAVEALGVPGKGLAQRAARFDVIDHVDEGVLEDAGAHLVFEDLQTPEHGQAGVLEGGE